MPLDINGQGSISGITSLNTVVSDAELERLDGVTSAIQTQLNDKLPIAGGKILQIVRATDSTTRTTTSTSFTDASISVTITPQKNNSAILILWIFLGAHTGTQDFSQYQITDNSNNTLSGASNSFLGSLNAQGVNATQSLIGYSTPATTSAITYKGRFRVANSGTNTLSNGANVGQLYAIEVSA